MQRENVSIVRRLQELVKVAEDEYPETQIPSLQSIGSALKFLKEHPELRMPDLTLTPAGNIWAEWRKGGQAATLEFLRNGSVLLAAVFPDAREPWERTSLAGTFSPWQLQRFFHPEGTLGWVRR